MQVRFLNGFGWVEMTGLPLGIGGKVGGRVGNDEIGLGWLSGLIVLVGTLTGGFDLSLSFY